MVTEAGAPIDIDNPPFSLDKWGADSAGKDPHRRFWRGIPPKSKGDYAFISHMVEVALADEGRQWTADGYHDGELASDI